MIKVTFLKVVVTIKMTMIRNTHIHNSNSSDGLKIRKKYRFCL